MIYKCKICGGDIVLDRETGIAECDSCGTMQTLPLFTDESTRSLFDRGNAYLRQNEYDKAQVIFDQLTAAAPRDPEVYWSLVMCKYGVTFVLDPNSGKYIPTCNRTHYDSILADQNYLKTIEFADPAKAELYKHYAGMIDDIQRGIIEVSKKEKPFDIFISYKETDENGSRTKDSVRAQELYEKLTAEGYKVFFSRITLEDRIGSEYEPYIYAALASSKVMLTVSSKKEYIDAPWVENEWSRFLTLRQNDPEKTLIPLYYDMYPSELPGAFAILTAHDMNKDGFEQELLRGIKKLIPLPVMLAEKRKKFRKRFAIGAVVCLSLLAVAGFISYPYIRDAVKYSDDYNEAVELYNEKQYEKALAAFEKLGDYRDSKKMREKSVKALHKEELQAEYDAAMELYYAGKYPQAAWAFRDMTEKYEDSAEMQKKSEARWRESLAEVAIHKAGYGSDGGKYYITANGTVAPADALSYSNDVVSNSHGRVVSIAMAYPTLALHEDGYLQNSKVNFHNIDQDLENIIQITAVNREVCVALKNDGSVAVGSLYAIDYVPENDPDYPIPDANKTVENDYFLNQVTKWKDIVRLSWANGRIGNGATHDFILCGIDVNGNVHVAGSEVSWKMIDAVESVKNAVQVTAYNCYHFAVLDKNETINVFEYNYNTDSVSKKTISAPSNGCKSIAYGYRGDLLCLTKTGDLVDLESGKTLLTDVVCMNNRDYAVTASGSLFDLETMEIANLKTVVYDVWNEKR